MYYQNYEDYMRSVLGYPVESTYDNYIIQNREYSVNYQNNSELESMYPEIYKKINPVVCEVCERSKEPITKEVIENMVEEVYQKIDINNEIYLKINIDNNVTQKEIQQNRTSNTKVNNQVTNITNNREEQMSRQVNEVENRQRRQNNPLLRDLIRILILNQILGGGFPHRPPRQRPPFPGPGGRPPFPGGPGIMPPPRPEPRNYEDYFKF